jgi:hypothetical protein
VQHIKFKTELGPIFLGFYMSESSQSGFQSAQKSRSTRYV